MVFNPVVKLVLENQPFLMPEPAEKPSLQEPSYYLLSMPNNFHEMYVLVFVCVY